jgi:hypothetical protein
MESQRESTIWMWLKKPHQSIPENLDPGPAQNSHKEEADLQEKPLYHSLGCLLVLCARQDLLLSRLRPLSVQ